MDSPLLRDVRGRPDGRSPGLATLKEAFDVTYAVHRMEEEGARRRAYAGPRGAGARGFLHELNEDDEDEEEAQERGVIDNARRRHEQGDGTVPAIVGTAMKGLAPVVDGRTGQRDVGAAMGRSRVVGTGGGRQAGHANAGFALDMDNATLLGRRHRRGVEPSLLGQAVYANLPGSPMRGVEAMQ